MLMVCILSTCGQKGDRMAKSRGITAEVFVQGKTSSQYPMPKGEVSCNNTKFCLVPISLVNNPATFC
jgi:hypothetical protein